MTFIDFIIVFIIILILVLFGIRKRGILSSFTGGKLDEYLNRWEVYAPQSYQKIRATNDIQIIAEKTGFSQVKIAKIKEHIFFKEHQLDDCIRLFDPDPDIADAWFRLQEGDYNDQDLRLLKHEYFEARFEGIFQTDYRTSHNATIKSGRTWTP
ncbi:hypothetical protein PCC7805_03841 [Planktothrix agardhii]|uniref:Uncharacterized protein n=1 Tax=Planktothrix agardhii TaxID=1160 RepID=A0A1J1JCN1_PLAAG|nr:hypothetical protein [Planktothrix agardhii]CAD5971514.1 hypothetical protein PCC7805_03841 [Planktothrix agardhii]CUM58489.1 conserved protein of unknown function [Planktothrix agardhii]